MSSAAVEGRDDVLTVAPMRRRHLPEVLAIEAAVYPRPWSSRLFEDELGRSGRAYVVGRVGSEVVGYAGLLMIADDGHVATVAVSPAWQGRGVGRALLGSVIRRAMGLGAAQLTLEVRVTNLGAQHLYRQFGFAPGGARKAYYADNGEDALVMWAHDIRSDAYRRRLDELDDRSDLRVVHVDLTDAGEGASRPETPDEPRPPSVAAPHPAIAGAHRPQDAP